MKADRKNWVAVEPGIYLGPYSKIYHERPTINGRRTYRSLGTDKLAGDAGARAIFSLRRARELMAREGAGVSPYTKPELKTVGEVIRRYQSDGCLDHQRQQRPTDTRTMETGNCKNLLLFWDTILIDEVTLGKCDQYCDWRRKQIERKNSTGYRTVDLDLNTLNNAMIWAWRCEIIKINPLAARRPKYSTEKNVRHCREFKARDIDQVHAVARWLFKKPLPDIQPKKHGGFRPGSQHRTEVCGWQWLLENLTGIRTSEALRLRTDAQPGKPGYIEDWKILHVDRSKNGVNPFIIITPDLEELLRALLEWKDRRFPNSTWFFPSYKSNGVNPVDESTLSHNLVKASKHFGLKLTSHGARAFYVTMRRSWGISDAQIAVEIGHTSGGATLIDVYGGVPTNWLTGSAPKMSWTPNSPRAWGVFETEASNIVQLRTVA